MWSLSSREAFKVNGAELQLSIGENIGKDNDRPFYNVHEKCWHWRFFPECHCASGFKRIRSKTPKTRYVVSKYGRLTLFMRKMFSDRMLDRVLYRMFKI
jgi:hypothetical protein